MTDIEEPAFVAETLAWCNSIRAEKGQPPLDRMPKGIRYEPESCPCGAATGISVWLGYYSASGDPTDGEDIDLPSAVTHFVQSFDAGELPQYEEQF